MPFTPAFYSKEYSRIPATIYTYDLLEDKNNNNHIEQVIYSHANIKKAEEKLKTTLNILGKNPVQPGNEYSKIEYSDKYDLITGINSVSAVENILKYKIEIEFFIRPELRIVSFPLTKYFLTKSKRYKDGYESFLTEIEDRLIWKDNIAIAQKLDWDYIIPVNKELPGTVSVTNNSYEIKTSESLLKHLNRTDIIRIGSKEYEVDYLWESPFTDSVVPIYPEWDGPTAENLNITLVGKSLWIIYDKFYPHIQMNNLSINKPKDNTPITMGMQQSALIESKIKVNNSNFKATKNTVNFESGLSSSQQLLLSKKKNEGRQIQEIPSILHKTDNSKGNLINPLLTFNPKLIPKKKKNKKKK